MKAHLPLFALILGAALPALAANPGYEEGDEHEQSTTTSEPERPQIHDNNTQINTLTPRTLGGRRGGSKNGDTSGSSGGGDAGSGGGGALPKDLEGTQWEVVPGGIRAMREHTGAHGVMRVPGPKRGVSVAFMTNPVIPDGEFRNGRCAAGENPTAKPDGACHAYMWISAKPGGGPVGKDCFAGPLMPVIVTQEWFAPGKGFKGNMRGSCALKPGKAYWCNFTATGFDRAKKCDMGLASPVSDMDGEMGAVLPK